MIRHSLSALPASVEINLLLLTHEPLVRRRKSMIVSRPGSLHSQRFF